MADMTNAGSAGSYMSASAAEAAMAEVAMLALIRTGIFSGLSVEDGQVHGFSPYGNIAALLDREPDGQDFLPDWESGEDGLADGDWVGLLDSRDSEPGGGSSGPARVRAWGRYTSISAA